MKVLILPAMVQILLLTIQGIGYLLIQRLQGEVHDMARPVDQKIPLITQAVYIYGLWYPLIFLYPLYLYVCSQGAWRTYLIAIVLNIICSLLIYLFYPTSFQRPEPSTVKLSGKILSFLYIANYKGLNCMPSMHCSQCFIILLSVFTCGFLGVMASEAVAGIAAVCILIVGSTVLIKQHVVIDVVSAFPLGIVCFISANLITNLL